MNGRVNRIKTTIALRLISNILTNRDWNSL